MMTVPGELTTLHSGKRKEKGKMEKEGQGREQAMAGRWAGSGRIDRPV